METIKSFIKNYKKILIGSLICLIIILSATIGSMIVGVRDELDKTNDIQLEEVINNLENIYDYSANIVDGMGIVTEEEIVALAKLLRLSPEDIHESAVMDQYMEALSNLYQLKVLDQDRNEVYSYNFDTNENFNDPYFDPLFAADQGQSATLPDRNGGQTKYICARSGDYYILSEVANAVSQNSEASATIWQQAFVISGFSSISTVAVVDDETGEVIYCDDDSLILEKIDTEQINARAEYMINGRAYKAKVYRCPERGVNLVTLTDYRDLIDSYTANIILVIALFVVAFFILLAYIVCLRQSEIDPSQEYKFAGKYFLRSQTRIFRTVIIVLGFVFSFTFISVSMLNADIEYTLYLQKEINDSVDVIDSYQVMDSMIETENADKLYDYARIAGKYLTFHSDRLTKKDLGEIAQLLDVSDVTLFDYNGKTTCTSTPMDHFSVIEDKESPLYELRYVLMGKEGVSVSGDPKTMDETDVIYAVPNRGEDGVADGITAVITYNGMTNKDAFGSVSNMKGTVQKLKMSRNRQGFMFVVADKEGKIILHQNESLIGANLEDIGIDSETIRHNEGDGTVGRLKINGRDQLFTVMMTKNAENYVILIQQAGLLSGASVSTAVIAIILYILLACWIMYDGLGSKVHFEERKQNVKGAGSWRDTKVHWQELSAGQKMSKIIGICVHIFSVYLIITYFLASYKIIEPVGIAYIMLGDWQKSVNIYSIFGNICLAAIFFSIISFTTMVLHTASNASEQSGKTACRLLANIIKYVGAIICCYLIVTNFGINAAAAIASIGIAGFGLTFGAQDLIKDLIAGIFILFEGNFKVGDMLVVDGKWFWVKSIGVRTTTLEAWGEKKVINNSQMSGVLNIQRANTNVDCDIMIDNRYDLDTIEEILNRELPSLKDNYPNGVAAPKYKGVQNLSGSGTTIRIRTYVPPLYQGKVGRQLRGDVKRVFDKYGIMISSDRFTIVDNNLTKEELAEELLKIRKEENEGNDGSA